MGFALHTQGYAHIRRAQLPQRSSALEESYISVSSISRIEKKINSHIPPLDFLWMVYTMDHGRWPFFMVRIHGPIS